MLRRTIFLIGFMLIAVITITAQGVCGEFVQIALESVDQVCGDIGRNQACYGNISLEATAQPDATNFQFANLGDIVDVAAIQSLELSGFDQEAGTWGVVLMRVQANIPDSLPGQNVTILLFGDTQLQNAADSVAAQVSSEQSNPMQAFYFTTGIGQTTCNEAPSDGILIQTPEGVGEINLSVNEVEINMGSTVYFTLNENRSLEVTPIEGAARVTSQGVRRTAVAGARIRVPLDENYLASDEPLPPESYLGEEDIDNLPIEPLERDIEIEEGLDDEELALLEEYEPIFNNIDIDDTDEFFDYVDSEEDPDIVDFLVDDLGYTDLDDEAEAYIEDELGIELDDYDGYEGDSDDTGYDDSGDDDTGYDDSDDDGYDDTGYDDSGYDDTGYDDGGYDDEGSYDDSGDDDGGYDDEGSYDDSGD